AVGTGQFRPAFREYVEVIPHGAGVPPGNRPGQCLVTTPQCIVQRGGEQRSQEPFRIVDSATTQQLSTVGDQRDQVICPVRERGVVQGTGLFRNLYRLGPHLDGQCRTDVRGRLVI